MAIICSECKNKMGDLAHYCNECGARLPPPSEPVDSEEQKERESDFSFFKDGKLGFCGEGGHLAQALWINASFCAVCGADLKPLK